MRALLMAVAQQQRRGAVAPSYPAILNDGNTIAWYDYTQLSTITKDANNFVSKWDDRLGTDNFIMQDVDGRYPLLEADGILFDGSNDILRTYVMNIPVPYTVYMVMNHLTLAANSVILGHLSYFQNFIRSTGAYRMVSGVQITTGVVPREVFNSLIWVASLSSSMVNLNGVVVTGGAATLPLREFGVGGNASTVAGSAFTRMKVKELVIRKIEDTTASQTEIYDYLKTL